MLQLGKCAKDNSKIFLLNTKVLKMSFGNIKFDFNFFGSRYNKKKHLTKNMQKYVESVEKSNN